MNFQSLALVTAPSVNPVTLAEVKEHLRVDTTDEDTLIATLISAAVDYVSGRSGFTGRALVTQTWDYYLPEFPANNAPILLPLPPVQSVTSVIYKDENGTEQTLATSIYGTNNASEPAALVVKQDQTWPETYLAWDAVKIRFVAGYAPTGGGSPTDFASGVPDAIKAAIFLTVGDLYQNREAQNLTTGSFQINHTVKNLLNPYRADMGL